MLTIYVQKCDSRTNGLVAVFRSQAVVDQSRGQFIDIDVLDQDPGDDDELGR